MAEKILGVDGLISKVSSRASQALELKEQLPAIVKNIHQSVDLQSQIINVRLSEEAKKPFQLGVAFAEYGESNSRPEFIELGSALVNYIEVGKDPGKFLEENPSFNDIDLTGFFEMNEDLRSIAENDVPTINLEKTLVSGSLVVSGDVFNSEELTEAIEPKKQRGRQKGWRKDKTPKQLKETKKVKESKEVKKKRSRGVNLDLPDISFEKVAEDHPIVAELFTNDECWETKDNQRFLNQTLLFSIFEQKEITGDAVKYQAILKLSKDYCGYANIKYDQFSRPVDGKRIHLILDEDVKGFLRYAAARLDQPESVNLQIRAFEEGDFSKKKAK